MQGCGEELIRLGSQEADKGCHLLLGLKLGNRLDTRLPDAKRPRIQADEMGEGSLMAEICQTWHCDGQTGREAGRNHEL